MEYNIIPVEEPLRSQLIEYCYPIIKCLIEVHKDLGRGMPEYIYQEACKISFDENQFVSHKEYVYHPTFHGKRLESFLRMDFIVERDFGNVIIESKAIKEITDKEQYQLFNYLRGTSFPIGILVNFGTWPKAQIQRYYFDKQTGIIRPF